MSERDARRERSWVDYSDRGGFSQPSEQMRGRARSDFQMPRDMAVVLKSTEELALP